jgi:RNA polymerase sigma-70 factor (ECF subfamily)
MSVAADTDWENGESAGGADALEPEKSKLFLRVFLQNERRLYAYILTLLPHRADADDVLQQTSLVMWDKFDAQSPPLDFAAWGCRIAYFKVLDFYKTSRRSPIRFSQTLLERVAETAMEHSATLQINERSEALADCVDKLAARDRDLLRRRFAEGATTRSTAAEVGRSIEAVYKSLSKIRQALFDCVTRTLEREGRA